jgi:hypothetical protein
MKTRKTIRRVLLEAAKKIGEREVIRNASHWPPYCGGFAHQPKRPSETAGRSNNKY